MVCEFMTPSHGAPPQFIPSPYEIVTSADCYTTGGTLQGKNLFKVSNMKFAKVCEILH